MKLDVLLIGSKGLTFEAEVIQTVERNNELFVVHAGHNKLMHTIVITHWKTGTPVGMSKVNPETVIDEKISQKYVDFFEGHMKNFVPGDRKIINTLPEESA